MSNIDILRTYIKNGNFDLAINKADEILETDCNNVFVLLTRAWLCEVTNDISGAKQTYEKILEIDPNNDSVKEALCNISNNEKKMNSYEEQYSNNSNPNKYILKILLIIILLIVGFIFVYLHPSKEEMICNSNLKCNIKHEFLGFIKYNTSIDLGADSRITARKSCRYSRTTSPPSCVVHVNITDKYGKIRNPFIYYYTGYGQTLDYRPEAEDFIKYEINSFNYYLQNPKGNFHMVPQSGNSFIVFMLIGFVSIMGIYYVGRLLGIIDA